MAKVAEKSAKTERRSVNKLFKRDSQRVASSLCVGLSD
ncbi:hypothetical protein N646_0944 [Vibrio alginolyticus NBRC 15630 = ATCC 17749]|uniref:Uncharacterized protein n=1 Tax=Vibrio alginolyticus (strain ATCC 17749 / DSM 2171 / NBRC 15630 / NCIMB 1903 / NCTC 12160 / XII-53) TaxID=1219076 RepID=A0A2I3C5A1_VIBAX|nr:hypothetical protein N646_0814 [Vibrio alginolyticus NBRC 15630 = ATCC 17749]AGV16729.1 hypothetical protein N646_0896 [Vibrio alginolyticus NBRC 15630 = ATCC 17749]AGV16756.1 hypothetical protein N646_0923 [Vibrio alginolyticus NBRC 15630 = ATCC 17749]AGV16777.1 hypothetical protein N646_0944 [Vibrio alginolyticus NBRC 15630 = ATCC 17749]